MSAVRVRLPPLELIVERINELLEGDRASDVELQKLAQRLVKLNGEAWEEDPPAPFRE